MEKKKKKPVIGYGANVGAGKKATKKAVKKVVGGVAGGKAKGLAKKAVKNAMVQVKQGALSKVGKSKSSPKQMVKNDLRYNIYLAKQKSKKK